MNEQLVRFARETLKEGLHKCTDREIGVFKRMYSPTDLTKNVYDVVDAMPVDKLDWAMTQVQRTIKNRK